VLVHHPPDREVGVFLVEFHGSYPRLKFGAISSARPDGFNK
jgi:hypothetical protein